MNNIYQKSMQVGLIGLMVAMPATSRAMAQLPTVSVQGCSGVTSYTEAGTQICITSPMSSGDGGGGGGGMTTYDTSGGGGGTSTTTSTTTDTLIVPILGYPNAWSNLFGSKIKVTGISLGDEMEVRMGVVAAANATHSNKPLGAMCTVYYSSTGQSEKWVKQSNSGSYQWGPVAGSQTP